MLELFKNETFMPFAYFTVLIFAWRVSDICIYPTREPIFLILVCTSGHSAFTSVSKNRIKQNKITMLVSFKNVLDQQ